MSGTNDNRAAFQQMLKDSSKKQFQYVIVYKLDRFARNKVESVINKKTLQDNGVSLLSAMERITDTPEGRMMETILEGFNQYFSEELTQKVNRGLRESWLKGNATGGHSVFGYDIIDKKYVPHPIEAPLVVEMFTKCAQGYTANAIEKYFKECGYRNRDGQTISLAVIYRALSNQKYTGTVERQGVKYDNIFPRLISDEIWNIVSKIHEENKHAPSRKKEVFNYLLSGKLICGDCNQKMVGISGTSKTGDTHYYYSCLSRTRKKINCNSKPIQKKLIEDLVIEITTKVIATESNINMLAQKISSAHKSTCEDNSKLKMLEKSRAEAVRSQNNIIKAIEQGIITSATKNRLNELETLITQYDFDIQHERAKTESFLTAEQVKEYLYEFVNVDTTDLNVRKLIINTFVRDVILYNDNIVITYNFKDLAGVPQVTKEYVKDIEQQIESADPSAVSFIKSSHISLARTPQKIIRTQILSSYFFCVIRDSNGRNRTQSCELCARPGVIAQTFCKHNGNAFVFLCCASKSLSVKRSESRPCFWCLLFTRPLTVRADARFASALARFAISRSLML